MTWVGILNMVFFQFLFVRLARTFVGDKLHGFRFMYGVKPFTGWNISPYKFVFKDGQPRFTPFIFKTEWISRSSRTTRRTSRP